jgi:ferric iron reductase protein FhuF
MPILTSSLNRHDMTEILLKVALNIIRQTVVESDVNERKQHLAGQVLIQHGLSNPIYNFYVLHGAYVSLEYLKYIHSFL